MAETQTIYEPAHAGAPFIAAIFDLDGRIVASHGFPTRAGAEAFLQAFRQDEAGERGSPDAPDAAPYRR
jgi:beta-phosphoglucomutase-like phosphatase (HAD superfamily)